MVRLGGMTRKESRGNTDATCVSYVKLAPVSDAKLALCELC